MKKYNEDDLKMKNVYDQSERDASSFWTHFFDPSQQKKLDSTLRRMGVEHSFFGGYPRAERKLLFVRASWDMEESPPPVVALVMDVEEGTTHRDVLGALLSTGITRDQLGDILVSGKKAYVFMLENMSNYIQINLEKIRNTYASLSVVSPEEVEIPAPSFQVEQKVLSSLRLDNTVAKSCKISRTKAAEIISKGYVKVDHEVAEKPTVTLEDGVLVSVRGYGRFLLHLSEGLTKKGNQKVEIHWFM